MGNVRHIDEEQCKYVYTLNTWSDKHMDEAGELLKSGYYVHFGSTAIGHTLSEMVETEGIQLAKKKFGKKIEVVVRDGWGWEYVHLVR